MNPQTKLELRSPLEFPPLPSPGYHPGYEAGPCEQVIPGTPSREPNPDLATFRCPCRCLFQKSEIEPGYRCESGVHYLSEYELMSGTGGPFDIRDWRCETRPTPEPGRFMVAKPREEGELTNWEYFMWMMGNGKGMGAGLKQLRGPLGGSGSGVGNGNGSSGR